MLDRSTCGQRIFGGCPGESCDRQCSATIWIPPSETTFGRHMLKQSRSAILKASAVILALFFAGYAGAAVTAQGVENWKSTRIEHVQP